jgi:hypothetical protein
MIKISVLLFLLSSMLGKSQIDKSQIITIEPYMSVTNGAFFKQLILKSNDSDAEFIQGFDFEWGYSYKLKILIHKLKNPPEDGSDTDYRLVKIVSKTKVPDNYQFQMMLASDFYLGPGEQVSNFKSINDSTYVYFDKINIEVASTLRTEFKEIITKEQMRYGHFVFISPTKIKLIKLD